MSAISTTRAPQKTDTNNVQPKDEGKKSNVKAAIAVFSKSKPEDSTKKIDNAIIATNKLVKEQEKVTDQIKALLPKPTQAAQPAANPAGKPPKLNNAELEAAIKQIAAVISKLQGITKNEKNQTDISKEIEDVGLYKDVFENALNGTDTLTSKHLNQLNARLETTAKKIAEWEKVAASTAPIEAVNKTEVPKEVVNNKIEVPKGAINKTEAPKEEINKADFETAIKNIIDLEKSVSEGAKTLKSNFMLLQKKKISRLSDDKEKELAESIKSQLEAVNKVEGHLESLKKLKSECEEIIKGKEGSRGFKEFEKNQLDLTTSINELMLSITEGFQKISMNFTKELRKRTKILKEIDATKKNIASIMEKVEAFEKECSNDLYSSRFVHLVSEFGAKTFPDLKDKKSKVNPIKLEIKSFEVCFEEVLKDINESYAKEFAELKAKAAKVAQVVKVAKNKVSGLEEAYTKAFAVSQSVTANSTPTKPNQISEFKREYGQHFPKANEALKEMETLLKSFESLFKDDKEIPKKIKSLREGLLKIDEKEKVINSACETIKSKTDVMESKTAAAPTKDQKKDPKKDKKK